MKKILLLSLALALPAAGEVTIRARVSEVEPEARVRIFWSWGGQGLGGSPVGGEFTSVALGRATVSPLKDPLGDDMIDVGSLLDEPGSADEILVERGKSSDFQWLRQGVWSPAIPLSAFQNNRLKYLTITAQGCKLASYREPVGLKRAVFDFEVFQDGRSLKTFSEESPSGAVGSIVLPVRHLLVNPADPTVLASTCGLLEHVRRLRQTMEGLPWASDRLPELYEIITDCGGYGTGPGFGIRTSSREVFFEEFKVMRQLGINGLRNRPSFFMDLVKEKHPGVAGMIRLTEGGVGGYPFAGAPFNHTTGKLPPLPWGEGVGCPWHPVYSNRAEQARARFEKELAKARELPFATWWDLTVDEIGSAFDGTGEGKSHMGVCPHCTAKFRDYLKGHGLAPADFDAKDWAPVRSTYGYFEKTYEERERERLEAAERDRPRLLGNDFDALGRSAEAEALLKETGAQAASGGANAQAAGMTRDDTVVDLSDEEVAAGEADAVAEALAEAAEREGIPPSPTPELSARGWHKLAYWSRRFNNDGSAMLFTPMRDVFQEANDAKRRAIAEGRLDSIEARQPWMFLYALRGNTFLMGGHSLDFFDFYRYADTGFMYETSNRDPRVWMWDSYLCDVGRILHDKMGKAFGVYVKPHRGAPTQRALSAIARGARTIYWYTYGPEWAKGDSFGGSTNIMFVVSRAARLIGEAEPVTWEGRWTKPAEIAVVRPRTAEFFGNSAQLEDGKWVYAALMHAHLPMDPLDEEFLMSEDLARYKAIYVTGSHIRRDVAKRLADYVNAGGTLFTGCGGLQRDEAGQGISELLPVFGVASRTSPLLWGKVPRYGATALGAVTAVTNAPADASVKLAQGAPFALKVGYEKLKPAAGAEVLATFGDGSPALVRNRFGKGQAYLAGWYTGVEYATGVMKAEYNTATDLSPEQRDLMALPAKAAGVLPVVEASSAMVEGVRIVNPKSGREAVVLINWGRQGRELVAVADLSVRLRDAGTWKGARSVYQRRSVPARRDGADLLLDVGLLDEGDVLLLE